MGEKDKGDARRRGNDRISAAYSTWWRFIMLFLRFQLPKRSPRAAPRGYTGASVATTTRVHLPHSQRHRGFCKTPVPHPQWIGRRRALRDIAPSYFRTGHSLSV